MVTRSGSIVLCAAFVILSACGSEPTAPTAPNPIVPPVPPAPPTVATITIESVTPSPGATLILGEDCPIGTSMVPCNNTFRMVLSIVTARDVSDGRLWLFFASPTSGCELTGSVESIAVTAGVPTSVTVPRLYFPLQGSYEPPNTPPVCSLPSRTTGSLSAGLYEGAAPRAVISRIFADYIYTLERP